METLIRPRKIATIPEEPVYRWVIMSFLALFPTFTLNHWAVSKSQWLVRINTPLQGS